MLPLSLTDKDAKRDLTRIRQWADEKIQGGSEPPWAWFQYMKLIEVADAILGGMAVTTTENSQQSEEHQGSNLRLVDAKCPRDTSQRHRGTVPVRMPM